MTELKHVKVFLGMFAISSILWGLQLLGYDMIGRLILVPGDPYMLIKLVTYSFIHGSWPHLLYNYALALPVALYLEPKIGDAKFALLWIFSSIISAVFFIAMNPLFLGVLGSSGVDYAICTYGALYYCISHKLKLPIIAILSAVVLHQLYQGMHPDLFDSTAHLGHVGGALGGALLFFIMEPLSNAK